MTSTPQYAIIIDSGSSGSRALVYEYTSDAESNPNGLPTIRQVSNFKTKPGLSTFGSKKKGSYDLWSDHFESLIRNVEESIPKNLHAKTPVFVQATAGMRLLPAHDRDRVLDETCSVLTSKSNFIIEPCNEHVEVIDGDTEGLYGWLAINYLTNKLNNYKDDDSLHLPYGFMDMGGASTQLAFVPSNPDQLDKHLEDMYSVNLRSNDGNLMNWSVFVSSWLGFGANEARRRQLDALVNALPSNVNYDKDGDGKGDLVDPCSPIGMQTEVEYRGKVYTVTGSGEYEGCLKTIYPLLLKHLPCKDEPCLFNGVHAPSMDFSKEKFVGVSEYWYTANDVFKLSGEYNYETFEQATKEFCSTDWNVIYDNFQKGEYGSALTLELLKTSCFKASWIVNVLHEGFDMPRLGLDDETSHNALEKQDEPIFKSVNNIDGNELSWTLGKMVLYASSQNEGDGAVGIFPGSEIQSSTGNSAALPTVSYEDNAIRESNILFVFSALLLILCLLYVILLRRFGNLKSFLIYLKNSTANKSEYMEEMMELEEGRSLRHQSSNEALNVGGLRTRSTVNLANLHDFNDNSGDKNIGTVPPPLAFEPQLLKNSFTFASFRDPNLYSKNNKGSAFKLGNGSQLSLKSMTSL